MPLNRFMATALMCADAPPAFRVAAPGVAAPRQAGVYVTPVHQAGAEAGAPSVAAYIPT